MLASDLDGLSRSDLISQAEALGVEKASVLTRAELADEIVRRTVSDPIERRIARGLLGVARDLVARVVERGLHLSDAAALIRSFRDKPGFTSAKPPLATVTLAEIYATQGHKGRALAVLDQVLENEPDHAAARELRDKVAAEPIDEPVLPPEPDELSSSDDASTSDEASPVHDDSDASPSIPAAAFSSPSAQVGQSSEPPGPLGMLDDAPLPEHYDTNEIVLMPVDPKTVFIYWEVRRAAWDQVRGSGDGGKLILRLLAVSPTWQGPSVETRDIEIEQLVGDWFVRDLPVGAVLRAAIGRRAEHGFAPLSVAMEVSTPYGGPSSVGASELALMTLDGAKWRSDGSGDPAIVAAVERARRRVARVAGAAAAGSSLWSALTSSPLAPLFTAPSSPFSGHADAPPSAPAGHARG